MTGLVLTMVWELWAAIRGLMVDHGRAGTPREQEVKQGVESLMVHIKATETTIEEGRCHAMLATRLLCEHHTISRRFQMA
jgi:hypothetical protein